ncbi:MAG TPA: RIP metalloprotease RseP [Thermosulfidibacter takaii]|uniref:Zinc metalloprotease n=1 Tax=Thermosulfidibacter takaii TaxID=412593 RepID=A0A7C0U674_9BACT|nr:RIP metalloprotease RseP [Thermosulfidibacter takaii]
MGGLLVAIILLGVLIFIHELGHFLAARMLGVGVERFSIGFGPKLWSVKRGDTEYVLALVPLGGYVKLLGEDPEEAVGEVDRERSFSHKPLWVRTTVVAAGPFFNLLFAVVVMTGVYLWGVPILKPVVGQVVAGSPAERAGLKAGDFIVSIEGKKIESWGDLAAVVQKNPGKPLKVVVKREGEQVTLTVVPKPQEARTIFGEKRIVGKVGIVAAGTYRIERANPFMALVRGVEYTVNMVYLTLVGIVKILQRVVPAKSVGGPILIVQMASKQVKSGLINLLTFMAFISINLGIINLFPIPILDGGHLLFFTIEGVRGKPVSTRTREVAQQVGLAIIIAIMVLAFYNDIGRLIGRGK